MGNSLYNIEQDMIALYDKIEQQYGEILPEDEEALAINKENFENKLNGYNQYIHKLDDDIASCKKEEARIKDLRKKYENRQETAKNTVLKAIQMFGIQTKTGGYAIEFPTFKFSTRRSESIVPSDERLKYLNVELIRFIEELNNNDMLEPNTEWDLQGLCNSLNANIKAQMEADGVLDKYLPFTTTDLELIELSIEASSSIANLFRSKTGVIESVIQGEYSKTELTINKISAKYYLNQTEDVNVISCCHKETNYSLQMK